MIKTILLAIDRSEQSDRAIAQAVMLAKLTAAGIVVLHVFEPPLAIRHHAGFLLDETENAGQAEQWLLQVAESIRQQAVSVSAQAVEGEPVEVILQVAKMQQADLIVLAAADDTDFISALLGGVVEKVVKHSPVSVWVVK